MHKTLIEQSKKGNTTAQYQLYANYVDAMFNVAMRMVGHREDAEDILQESFTEVFRKLDSFRYESTFGAWLKRIVINRCINHLKAKKMLLSPLEENVGIIDAEEDIKTTVPLELAKVKKCIEQLPDGYRHIINLYLIEGYDHVEIGSIMGISTSTSKSQYHRAKKKLVQLIHVA